MFIETDRLLLVPLTLDELKRAMVSKIQLADELGYQLFSDEMDDKMKQIYYTKINRIEKDSDNYLFYTYWQIVLKEEKIIVGEVGFKGLNNDDGELEVGYGTQESFRNKGYMTEALTEIIKWAFTQDKIKIKMITASTLKDNIPSHKVLKKAGLDLTHEDGKQLYWHVKNVN